MDSSCNPEICRLTFSFWAQQVIFKRDLKETLTRTMAMLFAKPWGIGATLRQPVCFLTAEIERARGALMAVCTATLLESGGTVSKHFWLLYVS